MYTRALHMWEIRCLVGKLCNLLTSASGVCLLLEWNFTDAAGETSDCEVNCEMSFSDCRVLIRIFVSSGILTIQEREKTARKKIKILEKLSKSIEDSRALL